MKNTPLGEGKPQTQLLARLLEKLYSSNIYESFICIAVLTFTGGFLNAYTYVLHGEYLSTMNTGNMARIGLAIAAGDMAGTAPYFMSIAGNALGAMTTFICRALLAGRLKDQWQKVCLWAEMGIFLCVGLLPTELLHTPINFLISFMAGFQLASFTMWEGNLVATTIASGNIRFVGEYMGNAILNPTWKNFIKLFLFVAITVSFVFGVVFGARLSGDWGRYSIFFVCFLLLVLLFLEGDITRKNKASVARA